MSELRQCAGRHKGAQCPTLTRHTYCPVHDPEKIIKRWRATQERNRASRRELTT